MSLAKCIFHRHSLPCFMRTQMLVPWVVSDVSLDCTYTYYVLISLHNQEDKQKSSIFHQADSLLIHVRNISISVEYFWYVSTVGAFC